jgi:hypothetical protein
MAEMPVRHRTLAPFGGITRIRFKGSPASHRTLSHCGSPAAFLNQNKTQMCEVNGRDIAPRCPDAATQSGMRLSLAKLLTRNYPAGVAAVASFMFV